MVANLTGTLAGLPASVNDMTDPQADSNAIRLIVNGTVVTVTNVDPTLGLLAFLRTRLQLTGSKEGCAEGDCGACTVVVGELSGSRLTLKTMNACIQWVPALDGKAVFTVEYLRQQDKSLHPVQQSMVDCHGSQCGFCTPGFVMSLWQVYNTHQRKNTRASDPQLRSALSGNLCRCTGYKPILEAGQQMFDLPAVAFDEAVIVEQLRQIARPQALTYQFEEGSFYAPSTLTELTQLRRDHPDAVILAGCTDMGLWVNKQFRELKKIIYVGQVEGFSDIELNEDDLRIGAGASLTDAYEALQGVYPQISEMHERFASLPVRNAGTLGGNVANGSPIGDSMPWLIALGARVVLANSQRQRSLLMEDYYVDYMQTALREDEVLLSIEVPRPVAGQVFRTYKISKRYDSDISAVCAAFCIQLQDDLITEAVVAFGGMAAIPKRAGNCEKALKNNHWDENTLRAAQAQLAGDYQPLSDMRASADNRQQLAQNLLYRFFLESTATHARDNAPLSVYEVVS